MKVDFYNTVVLGFLGIRLAGRLHIVTLLREQGFLDVFTFQKGLTGWHIVLYNVVNQGRFFKEIAFAEGMKFVELHNVNTEFYRNGRLQHKALVFLEGQYLYGHVFQFVQDILLKFFDEELGIRSHRTMTSNSPIVAFSGKVSIYHRVITIVDEISIKSGCRNGFNVLRYETEHHVQDIPPLTFGRFVSYRAFFFLLLHFRLGSRWFSLHIIVVRINHHTFTHQHRDIESVFILHQYDILSLKSCHNTASHFTEETNFISYLHWLLLILLFTNAKITCFSIPSNKTSIEKRLHVFEICLCIFRMSLLEYEE